MNLEAQGISGVLVWIAILMTAFVALVLTLFGMDKLVGNLQIIKTNNSIL